MEIIAIIGIIVLVGGFALFIIAALYGFTEESKRNKKTQMAKYYTETDEINIPIIDTTTDIEPLEPLKPKWR